VLCLQRIATENETQKNGIVAVVDFKNFGLHQVRHLTPPFLKKIADLIQVTK
jgi:retinaldehyde-binding protein 1